MRVRRCLISFIRNIRLHALTLVVYLFIAPPQSSRHCWVVSLLTTAEHKYSCWSLTDWLHPPLMCLHQLQRSFKGVGPGLNDVYEAPAVSLGRYKHPILGSVVGRGLGGGLSGGLAPFCLRKAIFCQQKSDIWGPSLYIQPVSAIPFSLV